MIQDLGKRKIPWEAWEALRQMTAGMRKLSEEKYEMAFDLIFQEYGIEAGEIKAKLMRHWINGMTEAMDALKEMKRGGVIRISEVSGEPEP